MHGADKAGCVVLRRKLKRNEMVRFFSELEQCVVGIEASGSAHHWARVLSGLKHTVRLIEGTGVFVPSAVVVFDRFLR